MYKVLIVDDNRVQIQSMIRSVRWKSFGITEIHTALDAFEGLEAFKELNPDIVITDIVMPEMNGIEMMKEMKKINSRVKFIFMSCYEDVDYLKEAIENDVISYILKPFTSAQAEESIAKIVNRVEYDQKYEDMSELLNQSMDLYQKSFFYRLIYSKSIEPKDLQRGLCNLGLDKFKQFIVVKIDLISKKGRFIDIYNLLNLTEEELLKFKPGIVVVEQDTRMTVVFMNEEKNDSVFVNEITEIISEYITMVQKEYNVLLNAGISRPQDSLEHISLMLGQADNALGNSLSFRDDGIYIYNEKEVTNWNYDIEELKKHLSNLLPEPTDEQIEDFVNSYCPQENYMDRYSIKIFCISVFTVLQMLLIERNIDLSENSDVLVDLWKKLNLLNSTQELRAWIFEGLTKGANLIGKKEYENHEQLVEKILNYIEKEYDTITGIEQIASRFCISASYARRIFKKQTGKTIFDVLFQRRMEEAKRMLKDPDAKIYKVAEAVGYTGKRYFINAFHEYEGCLPKEYQQRYIATQGENDEK